MKVIDMIDRIAKGEEVKFKIIETDEVLNLTKDMHLFSITHNEPIEWFIDEEWLNYEVEVIEKDKKIEQFTDGEMKVYHDMPAPIDDLAYKVSLIIDKINEIIDKLEENK